ncbi:ROK family protein [Streptomyces sp. NPDC093225]|uniref:ROK family transcriptional regulator n=1 Tax=Streptomyces sp. NPDC093225 TaxID=3366034 RepID=UPI00380E5875
MTLGHDRPGAPAAGDGRREANAATVLRTVLAEGPVARGAIARSCGLSPAAVSRQCTELLRLGLVRELPELATPAGVGRPQMPLDLHTGELGGPVAGALHIGVPGSTVGVVDLRGRVLERRVVWHEDLPPDRIPARVADELLLLLRESARERPLLGVGAAVGRWVRPADGVVVRHDALGWYDRPLAAELEERLGLPVRLDNHARAVAQSEILFGRPGARRSLVHLFVGNVVDAAFGTAGVIHQGPGAGAGEVAHLPVPGSDTACACGRTGCLGATASDTAVAAEAVRRGIVDAPRMAAVLAAAAAGHDGAADLLRERARAVGRAVALLLDVFNPDLVVVTEQSSLADPDYLAEIRSSALEHSRVCDDPDRIVSPHAGPDVLAAASATVLLHPLFAAPTRTTPFTGPVPTRAAPEPAGTT